eukprot:7390282-Prymnesium_polylepis.2
MQSAPYRDAGRCFHSYAANGRLCIPRNTHLLFIGESTMRFQYLLLAWALKHGVEYRDSDQPANDPRRLYNIYSFSAGGRRDPPNWRAFLEYTSAALRPHEHCDCRRNDPTELHIENRYFRLGSVQLTYLARMGREQLQGVWWPGDDDSLRVIHDAGTDARWTRQNISSGVIDLLPLLHPTHVIYWVGGLHLAMQHTRGRRRNLLSTQPHWGPLVEEELRTFRASFSAAGLSAVTTLCISRMALANGQETWMVDAQVPLHQYCSRVLDYYPTMRLWGREAYLDHIHVNDSANGILIAKLLEHTGARAVADKLDVEL